MTTKLEKYDRVMRGVGDLRRIARELLVLADTTEQCLLEELEIKTTSSNPDSLCLWTGNNGLTSHWSPREVLVTAKEQGDQV